MEKQREKCQLNDFSSNDYPEIHSSLVEFSNEIHIAYAVCRKSCGNKEFISDGETQICKLCGHQMFRTEVRKYILLQSQDFQYDQSSKSNISVEQVDLNFDFNLSDYPEVEPNSIKFPNEIFITYAVCRKDCENKEFIVEGQTDVCEYCGHHMLHTAAKKYILAKDQTLD